MDSNQISFAQFFTHLHGVHTYSKKTRITESMALGAGYLIVVSGAIIMFRSIFLPLPPEAQQSGLLIAWFLCLIIPLFSYRWLLDIWFGKRVFTEDAVHDTFFGFVRLRTWSAAYEDIWMLDYERYGGESFLFFILYDKTMHRMRCTDGMRTIIDQLAPPAASASADERS